MAAHTSCNHGCGLAVIQPAYYRHIYKCALSKFKKFAVNVWNTSTDGKNDEEIALEAIDCLEKFIKEIGLPTTLRALDIINEKTILEIALSSNFFPGSYKQMTKKDVIDILKECY